MSLSCQKDLFNLHEDYCYLNCAYMSPQLTHVEAIGIENLKKKNHPYLIPHDIFFEPVDQLKKSFAQLIHTKDFNRIALCPSTSYGIANAAQNTPIKKGQHILIVGEQFPSNYYSWEKLTKEKGGSIKIVSPPDTLTRRGEKWNQEILNSINKHTAAVAIGTIHWADGTLFDLKAIRNKTKEVGALLIIDGSQSVGAFDINVDELQPDALIVAGYKWLFCPYGTALAYYGPAFDDGIPIEESWMHRHNSEDFQNLINYQPNYKPLAGKYNVGQNSSFIHVPMMTAAIDQLLKWSVSNIQNYCKEITRKPLEELKALGCWIEDEDYRTAHHIGIKLPKHLKTEQLKAATQANKIVLSYRGAAIRISPNVYNTESDLQKLVDCIKSIA